MRERDCGDIKPFEVKRNGHQPRWIVFPSHLGEHTIIGPFGKRSADLIAEDTGGTIFKEEPDLDNEELIKLVPVKRRGGDESG